MRATDVRSAVDYKKAGLDLEKYEETMSGIQPLLDPHPRPDAA